MLCAQAALAGISTATDDLSLKFPGRLQMCVPQVSPHGNWIVAPARAQHLRGEAFTSAILLMRHWFTRRRQLRALSALDDRLLDDIGVSRARAERQIAKSFWNVYARRHLK